VATPMRRGWIRRTVDRLRPEVPTAEPPDHQFYIRADDLGPCCAYHAKRVFRSLETRQARNDRADDPSWSVVKATYVAERLGSRPFRAS
jgi:hypothetical protein